jgi:acyl-CoA reductase-like NAD-dependent aldehyde dehydrogenase
VSIADKAHTPPLSINGEDVATAATRTVYDPATGASVMREAAGTVKRVHMELGGKAPFAVFEDADPEAAADGAIAGAFANCGQDCTAATRIYVHDGVRTAFMERLLHKVDRLVVGDPLDQGTNLGPLVSLQQRERVHGFVEPRLRRRRHRRARRRFHAQRAAREEYTAVKHVGFELTGAPRKEWYDAVSTPGDP